ncbi:1,4-dihydroxy-2-naphthoyl-CoA hydrolase [Arthrobacter woluwensis]|uniref:PaaI family thioesterase n=1 Tax=Arthrobacter woluwensis TaxID=156980 RepID=UPI00278B76CE|nr:PaaI family thioesterase [Arthrobacter woluwensis]MDQ0708039.1 1,4-dihydroxy-2-naphthoyl-CoA hydrolase [Arthrobacter woluwensis]
MSADEKHEPWTIHLGELDEKLGIRVLEQSADRVVTTMPVAGNTQSLGRLHGGASAALAEATGSWAGMIHASLRGKVCVGVDLNITHHRGARDGEIIATATPLHAGSRIATYQVLITDGGGRLLATARITNMLMDPKDH